MAPATCLAVLVVEDDADIREVVVRVLEDDGFQVYQAENGKRALEVLMDMPHPSLILADLMMPVMDGWSLIAALRQDDRLATLPVVIVSALDQSLPEGYRRVKKPIDLDDLVRIVGELCLRRS
jgi:two-component system chemotaxis response regulator CheY